MSSAPPKEAPVNAKDIDMARLSANATPKTDRKPSRFRGLFRQQSSSSASSSPATLQKSPPPVASSPLASPYVRPGYEQIGLLPSEQSMHSLQGFGGTEVGDGETIGSTAVEGASPKRHAEEAGRDSVESEVAKSQDTSPRTAGDADKRRGLPLDSSHKIAEAMDNANSSHVKDAWFADSAGRQISPDSPRYPQHGGPVEDPSMVQYKSTSIKRTNDFLKTARISPQTARFIETADEHGYCYSKLLDEAEPSPRKSFASNIFDDDSSLSQGIREYVTSKIAEALAEHNRERQGDADATVNNIGPLNLIIKIDAAGLAKANISKRLVGDDGKIGDFPERLTIGPFEISNAQLERDIQFGVMAMYAIAFLSASLLGPKTLLLTLWKSAIFIGVYAALLRQLCWTEKVERDVLLAPVCFVVSVATGMSEQLLEQLRMMMVSILAEAIERVAQSCDVQVHSE
ncbi:uncharacterized protein J4E78_006440 [Alternaria triticimaculans]|uniref:uncharacterized protein n=1 Tax=Alternaria triticimaculans TaxID=297637 RepID=UPI0020C4DEA4|nr:uncharacterized protein J4E78_006440 [Alternaria triticimaculans]KAI4656551.1 hypothetical protein J4E78_006440 [Alternaria triticimaculans]